MRRAGSGLAARPRSRNSQSLQKVYVKSYGCQMNVYDSHRMTDLLTRDGYVETPPRRMPISSSSIPAIFVKRPPKRSIPNSAGCAGSSAKAARAGRNLTIAVAGCVAQAEGEEIVRRARLVDVVVGPQSYHRLPELLAPAAAAQRRSIPSSRRRTSSLICRRPPRRDPQPRRHRLRDDPGRMRQVLRLLRRPLHARRRSVAPGRQNHREVEGLAAAGVREITLIGQNVNAYHGDDTGGRPRARRALQRLAEIPGLARLRYTTSHPAIWMTTSSRRIAIFPS